LFRLCASFRLPVVSFATQAARSLTATTKKEQQEDIVDHRVGKKFAVEPSIFSTTASTKANTARAGRHDMIRKNKERDRQESEYQKSEGYDQTFKFQRLEDCPLSNM
jgi:hypothetical protein